MLQSIVKKIQALCLAISFAFLSAPSLQAQDNAPVEIVWDRTYGGGDPDYVSAIIPLTDGGFLLGGTSWSNAGFEKSEDARNQSQDYWVVRIDEKGAVLWDKTYGGGYADHLSCIVAVPGGGYLLGGYSKSNAGFEKSQDFRGSPAERSDSNDDYWIIRTDADGNPLWDKTYGGASNDVLSSVVPASDGGFLLGGWSKSDAGFDKSDNARGLLNDADYWVVRINAQGEKLWDKTFGGSKADYLASIVAVSDGGFLLGGTSCSLAGFEKSEDRRADDAFDNDYWIIRIDAAGNILWDKTIGGESDDQLAAIVPTSGGGFLLGGDSNSRRRLVKDEKTREVNCPNRYNYWIVRIDAHGNRLWDKYYGGKDGDGLTTLAAATDGGFLIGGYSVSEASCDKSEDARGLADYWILRVDEQGNKLWDKTIGGSDTDELETIIALPDESFLLGGFSKSDAGFEKSENDRGNQFPSDFWLVYIRE